MNDQKLTRAKRVLDRKFKHANELLTKQDPGQVNLDDALATIRDVHGTYEQVAMALEDDDVDNDLDQTQDKYTDVVSRLSQKLKECQVTRNVAQGQVSVVQPSATHLRKMEIPKFDGSVRNYLAFKRSFGEIVSGDPKVALLRLQTESITQNSVEYFIVKSKTSLSDAWSALDDRFSRPNIVRDAVIKDLRELPLITKLNDSVGLRKVVNAIMSAEVDLRACGREDALGDSAFAQLMNKLPSQIRREVDQEVLSKQMDGCESVKVLKDICEDYARIQDVHELRTEAYVSGAQSHQTLKDQRFRGAKGLLNELMASSEDDEEAEDSCSQDQDELYHGLCQLLANRKSKSGGQGRVANTVARPSKKKCLVHKSATHSTSECREFVLKTGASAKKEIVLQNEHCLRCFDSHATSDCNDVLECSEPGCKDPKGHNTLIHSACLGITLACELDLTNPPKSELEATEIREHLGKHTVRPSHRAVISESGSRKVVNVLYDTGATLSQIRTSVAEDCGLTPINYMKDLVMCTAGRKNGESWGLSPLYKVNLRDDYGRILYTVKCVGVKFIGNTEKWDNEKVSVMFSENGLSSKDLLNPATGTIDILIGNNHADLFPTKVDAKLGVVWSECLFGELLHGSHPNFTTQRISAESHLSIAHVMLEGPVSEPVLSLGGDQDPELFTMRARSPVIVNNRIEPTSCDKEKISGEERGAQVEVAHDQSGDNLASKVCVCKTSDDTAFDRWVAVEDQSLCYKCKRPITKYPNLSKEDERRLKVYRECLVYDEPNKRFYTRMPWTKDWSVIPDNYPVAMKRFNSLIKSLQKDSDMLKRYAAEMDKLIQTGILVEVSAKDAKEWSDSGNPVWYVAHFAVMNENSESTPFRIVFDATVSYRGFVIGQMWEAPPNLIPRIQHLMLRFREKRIPIAMDISKAYWSIYLMQEESHLHRIVWSADTAGPPKIYRMLRNSWGMCPSGAICSVAMQEIAERYREQYPGVHKFIMNQVYVDDGTFSVDTIEEAYELAKDTCYVLSQGSFHVKHFIIGGNHVDVTEQDIVESGLPRQVRLGRSYERVLGSIWYPETDEIAISCRINFSKKKKGARTRPDITEDDFDEQFPVPFTQRLMASIVASPFDVCGLGCPCTIMLRHELGRVFELKLGWDGALPEDCPDGTTTCRQRCKGLIKMLFGLCKLRFDRCLRPPSVENSARPVLVIFTDSSQTAYAAMAYINWPVSDGQRESRLALCKARPFPKKAPMLDIPKGEACGAVLGVRLKETILAELSYDFERVIFATDSTIVLGQIAYDPSKFKTFMAGKIDEIQQCSDLNQWFHVESKLNPCDDLTRGLDPKFMDKDTRYQNGEQFMKLPVEQWPLKPRHVAAEKPSQKMDFRLQDPRMDPARIPKVQLATALTAHSGTNQSHVVLDSVKALNLPPPDPNDYLSKVLRRTSRIIRFLELLKTSRDAQEKTKLLNKSKEFAKVASEDRAEWISEQEGYSPQRLELQLALTYHVKQSQEVINNKFTRNNAKLNPKLDDAGIWRVHGRTSSTGHYPAIIPVETVKEEANPLVTILLRHFHEPCHDGADTTLAKLSESYWLIDGRRQSQKFVSKCVICRGLRKQPYVIEMAPMHPEQCMEFPVFTVIGVDLAGPYLTKPDKRTTRASPNYSGKVWVLVIMCVSSKAVNLELLEGYETQHFLAGFDAHVQLRGLPRKVIADLGSQIVGADNSLKAAWNSSVRAKIRDHDPLNIEWEFVPSGAHAFLGMVERMVKTFKQCMLAVTHSNKPLLTKLDFARLLHAIANLINDRPLAVGRSSVAKVGEDRLVRPNDILLGRSTANLNPLIPEYAGIQTSAKYCELIKMKEGLLNVFWSKFKSQVFHTMVPKEKWLRSGRKVQIGDIVLIRDSNAIRGSWLWGEVENVYESNDGLPRKALVRYKEHSFPSKSKVTTKAVRDLALLLAVEDR